MRFGLLQILLFSYFSSLCFGQAANDLIRCGSSPSLEQSTEELEAFEDWIAKERNSTLETLSLKTDNCIKIPVVFHILHYGEPRGVGANLSDESIIAQLEQVNNDLRKKEGTSGYNDNAVGADLEIELVAALYNPENYALETPGIRRINTIEESFGFEGTNGYSTSFINEIIKPATQWNPKEYLNIWVAELNSGMLGFAQFPEVTDIEDLQDESNAMIDGIVLNFHTVGSTDFPNPSTELPTYNKGRTLTHELGHWLGLRHTWGEGGCSSDDFCEDTPYAEGAHYGCSSTVYSCASLDMVENYMDYTDDVCKSVFTQDQKIRAHTVMTNAPRRMELLSSEKAIPREIVEMAYFNASMGQWSINLNWKSLSENENEKYVLYKVRKNGEYTKMADIDAVGFSTEPSSYSFEDKHPWLGINPYKLFHVDRNGNEIFLGDTSFEYYLGFQIELTPNPTQGDVKVDVWSESEGTVDMNIYNFHGKSVHSSQSDITIGYNSLTADISLLPPGMYIAQLRHDTWRRTVKISKY